MPLLALCLIISGMIAPVAADSGYETIYSDWADNGDTVTANGCYVKFTIQNGSSNVYVSVKSPSYPDKEVTVSPGNWYYYYNLLRIYIVEIDQAKNKVLVDIARPSGSQGDTSSSGTKLSCDVPGQLALGGDIVSFPILIQNNNDEDKTYTLSSSNSAKWDVTFTYGDKGIYKVYVPKHQSKVVNLMIQTTGSTSVGEKKVIAYVDSMSIDLYVYITSVNQTVDVSTKVTSKISSIGDKIFYDIRLKNLQSKENIYKLSVTGLPENWYFRYKEDSTSFDEMAEVIVPASGEKNLVLEIVPPYSVDVGDYNFIAVITSPDGTQITKDLTLRLKSGVGMSVTTSKLAYEAKPGESFNIDVYVSNTGKGAALTNVYLETSAPTGWIVQVSPNQTNSIKAGDIQTFRVNVVPPGNIVASDYEVSIKVKSDQAEKEKDFRVTIKTESYIPYIGGAMILLVVVGLIFMFRKYGRR
ncbi:alpha-galactosidase [Methanocella sp. CWC-04]|uniref:Alpha-galactosidase n=2 Tax=Methanooceanicella nereidis TaxID=2052831 RepID=A0AAP2W649_9EURY|nr:NEW3 domain-containing protein [Methanocella sp. CWC-04]MCD1294988.1 alpha-galactosidase [Methanocella sp. CWC-04]